MSDQNPLVTVYIPTYNRVDLLKRAVESVRNQTYKHLEIIIVDDCSTDTTHEYLKQIEILDKRIRYFIKEKNSGACISRNIAIENASGKYITGLDDDDYFLENRIKNLIEKSYLLKKYKFIATNYTISKNNILRKKGGIRPRIISYKELIYANYIGNQIFCEVEDLKRAGLFDPELKAWQDYSTWLNFSKINGKGICLDNYSYVLDDNDHNRITNQNRKDKITNVFNIIVNKNNIKDKEKKILSVNLVPYGITVPFYYSFLVTDKNHYFTFWFWKRVFNFFKNIYLNHKSGLVKNDS